MVNEYNLKNRVIFTGWRKDIKKFYMASDIFFLPSRGEGLPGVIMEAMSHNLPIITTNIPCTTDLITEGSNGYMCNINEINCFVKRIADLSNNKIKRKKMGGNSSIRIKDYDWNKIIKKYGEMYN